MKKIILFALLGPFSCLGLAQIEVAVSEVNAVSGAKVIVPVTISNGNGIAALQFRFEFDEQFLSIEDDGAILRGDQLQDHSLGFNREGGRLSVALLSGSLASLKAGEGTLLQVVFRVADGLPEGSSSLIELLGIETSDSLGNAVIVSAQNGRVTVDAGANAALPAQNELIFPHLANGVFSGGRFSVALIVVNQTDAPIAGQISFFRSDGTPFELTLTDGASGSAFPFTARPRGSVFFRTDGLGDLAAGYARLAATGPVGGVLLFTAIDDRERILTEAGVGNSPAGMRLSAPVIFERGAVETGVALANVNTESVEVRLALKDREGIEIASQTVVLSAGEQLPRFVSEIFDTLTARPEFRGVIEMSATLPISVIALEQQDILLTTFPVVSQK